MRGCAAGVIAETSREEELTKQWWNGERHPV